jgi:hypothetical protein
MVWDKYKLGVSDPMMALGGRDTGIVLRTGASGVSRPRVGAKVISGICLSLSTISYNNSIRRSIVAKVSKKPNFKSLL